MLRIFVVAGLFCVTGCASLPALPQGQAAYQAVPARAGAAARDYRIGPLDSISVSVFQEPDLSLKEIAVDAAGAIVLPLAGKLHAGGETPTELADQIARQLSQRYIINPQVTVQVVASASQRVTVSGAVTEAGVFEIKGSTTLLDAIAMAKGVSRTAKMNDAVVFREVNGQRTGAIFDLSQIQRGQAEDPEILGGDTVVIGSSSVKAAWRDFLSAAPLLNLATLAR